MHLSLELFLLREYSSSCRCLMTLESSNSWALYWNASFTLTVSCKGPPGAPLPPFAWQQWLPEIMKEEPTDPSLFEASEADTVDIMLTTWDNVLHPPRKLLNHISRCFCLLKQLLSRSRKLLKFSAFTSWKHIWVGSCLQGTLSNVPMQRKRH